MNKRKYYLRIFDRFFRDETAQRFEDSPHRYAMYVLYQKMLLRSAGQGGRIMYRGVYADMEEQLAKDFNETRDMMQTVLSYFVTMGIAVKYDRYIYFPEAARLLGSESDSAERMRRYRHKVTAATSQSDSHTIYVSQSDEIKFLGRHKVTEKTSQSDGEESGEGVESLKDEKAERLEKARSYADIEDE